MQPLLILAVCGKRDVILARQRARQIASLLRFEVHEQACIAAGTFAVAVQALRQGASCRLLFQIEDQALHVWAQTEPGSGCSANQSQLRLVKPLPAAGAEFSTEDLRWIAGQLDRNGSPNVFDEIQHQNQEMLALLHALHIAKVQLGHLTSQRPSPSAA